MSIGKTEDIPTFVTRMQRNYAAHIIRKDNTSILKRAMFNDDDRRRTGPTLTLLKKAIAHEGLSSINFFQNTLNRIYWEHSCLPSGQPLIVLHCNIESEYIYLIYIYTWINLTQNIAFDCRFTPTGKIWKIETTFIFTIFK